MKVDFVWIVTKEDKLNTEKATINKEKISMNGNNKNAEPVTCFLVLTGQASLNLHCKKLRKVFETNFLGAVQTTQKFIDLLKKSDEPRIVNVSSGLASLIYHSSSPDFAMYAAYSCSKTALDALL